MRVIVAAAFAALVAVSVALAGGSDSPDMDRSCDDLLCRFGPWDGCDGWLAANRIPILAVSRRATGAAPGAKRVEDAAARAKARDALLAQLSSRDNSTATEALLALGRVGDVRDITPLANVVSNGQTSRQALRMAALGLGHLPSGNPAQADEARKALLTALANGIGHKDESACFWSNCAYALAMRGDAAAVPRLAELRRKAVKDSDSWTSPEEIGAICYALGTLGREDALPDLDDEFHAKRVRQPYAGDSVWSVVHALPRIGGPKALDLLREAARDKREFVRCIALQALGGAVNAADDDSAKLLRDALAKDNVPMCRQMAAIGLGRTGHASAGPALSAALDEASSVDRRFVAIGLAIWLHRNPDPKLSAQIARALEKTGSQDERVALMVACGLAGAQTARATIVDSIPKSRTGQSASSACFALGLLGAGPGELKLLHEVVAQSVDATARREAALALGLLRDHTVVDQLRAIIKSRSPDIDRTSAAICLGMVGDDTDIEFLLGVLNDRGTSGQLSACVVNALGRLLDRDEGGRLARLVTNGRWFWQPAIVDPFSDLRSLME